MCACHDCGTERQLDIWKRLLGAFQAFGAGRQRRHRGSLLAEGYKFPEYFFLRNE